MSKLIYLASDHAGFKLKNKIKKWLIKKHKIVDLGAFEYNKKDDYPDYALLMGRQIKKSKGILICGSGQGISIAANKVDGTRAAVCWDETSAKQAKEHLNANIICLGARRTEEKKAKKIINKWLKAEFKKGRHLRRIKKIKKIEKVN